LEQDNINNIVVSPNKIPTEVGNYVKTDKEMQKRLPSHYQKTL
jgi:hypothetical protein